MVNPEPPPVVIPDPEPPLKPTPEAITDDGIPLGGFKTGGYWSLASLFLSLIAALISIGLIIAGFVRRGRKDGIVDDLKPRAAIYRILAVIAGILTPVIWFILDDFSLKIAWINKWTVVIAALFIVHIVFSMLYQRVRDKQSKMELEVE